MGLPEEYYGCTRGVGGSKRSKKHVRNLWTAPNLFSFFRANIPNKMGSIHVKEGRGEILCQKMLPEVVYSTIMFVVIFAFGEMCLKNAPFRSSII